MASNGRLDKGLEVTGKKKVPLTTSGHEQEPVAPLQYLNQIALSIWRDLIFRDPGSAHGLRLASPVHGQTSVKSYLEGGYKGTLSQANPRHLESAPGVPYTTLASKGDSHELFYCKWRTALECPDLHKSEKRHTIQTAKGQLSAGSTQF
jgi:hypothetical protein